MKRVTVQLTFVVRDADGLQDLELPDLVTEIEDCLEDEHGGIAEYASAEVTKIQVEDIES